MCVVGGAGGEGRAGGGGGASEAGYMSAPSNRSSSPLDTEAMGSGSGERGVSPSCTNETIREKVKLNRMVRANNYGQRRIWPTIQKMAQTI